MQKKQYQQQTNYCGNLQNIKSNATLQKIRSKAKINLDRDKDQCTDLIIKNFGGHREYIKEVCVPFKVKIYSLEELNIPARQKVIYFL